MPLSLMVPRTFSFCLSLALALGLASSGCSSAAHDRTGAPGPAGDAGLRADGSASPQDSSADATDATSETAPTPTGDASPATGGDACSAVSCTAPPSAYCIDSSTLRSYAPSGSCAAGACTYATSDTTCANGCASGACAGTDPCSGVLCDSPPPPACTSTSVLETYAPSGTCSAGTCSYTATSTTCANGCQAGACLGDPCAGVTCNAPPIATCTDPSTLTSYTSPGSCSQGTCSYTSTETTCPNGCANGACTADACAGVTCTSPPAASCSDPMTLLTYAPSGTCSEGTCAYTATTTTCASGCSNGACTANPCAGVTCAAPPATYCSTPTTLRTFAAAGTCSEGACSYASQDTPCTAPANATPSCTSGACGFTCNSGYTLSGGACVLGCVNQCSQWGASCNGNVLQTCYADANGCMKLMTESCTLGCSANACNACGSLPNPLDGVALTAQTGFYKDVVLSGSYALTNWQERNGQYVGMNWGMSAVDVANPMMPTGGTVGSTPPSDPLYRLSLQSTLLLSLDQNGVNLLDVTTPANPAALGAFPFPDATTQKHDVSISGTVACLAAADGLHLINVSTPSAPQALGTYVGPGFTPLAVVCSGGYAALAGAGTIQIVDIHAPAQPALVASVTTGSFDSFDGGKLLAFDGVHAYEVVYGDYSDEPYNEIDAYGFVAPANGNPGSIAKVGSLPYVSSINAIALDGTNLYVDGADSVGIVDVTLPSAPAWKERVPFTGQPGGVAGTGSMVYASGVNLSVFDMSQAPAVVTLPTNNDYMTGAAVVGSIGYLARMTSGLVIEDLRVPTSPVVLGQIGTAATDIAVSGHYAFVTSQATSTSQLLVYDLTIPSNPVLAGQATGSGQYIQHLRLSNGRAYAMCDIGYLCVFDIQNPTTPTLLAASNVISMTLGEASINSDFDVSGNDLLLPTIQAITIVDVTTLSSPQTVSTVGLNAYTGNVDVEVSGAYAYAATQCTSPEMGDQCLLVIDISNPATPSVVGTAVHDIVFGKALLQTEDSYGNFNRLRVQGRWAFLTNTWGGVDVFDVSTPTSPVLATEYWTVNPADLAFLKDRFLTTYDVAQFPYPAPTGSADQVIQMCP